MTQRDFNSILVEPQQISAKHSQDLQLILSEFPYFQSARAMQLKALKTAESFKYNHHLKTTAAYTTDRSILFDFITSDIFKQDAISKSIKHNEVYINSLDVNSEDISVTKSIRIDDALKKEIESSKKVLDSALFQKKIEPSDIAHFELDESIEIEEKLDDKSEDSSAENILNIGKPLEFDLNERHSFNEWLSLTRFKPIDRTKDDNKSVDLDTKSEDNLRKKKFDLIDAFITKNPKLKPVKGSGENFNIAKAQMIQPEALMTETLARIYVEQKKYKKAIQSYKILSLKYPEKSGFFADQIKAVKQLQEKNNEE